MALLLVDQNKKRTQAIKDGLSGTPAGLNMESFEDLKAAILWIDRNGCDLIIVDQASLEDDLSLSSIKNLSKLIPILILKKNHDALDLKLDSLIYDVIGPEINRHELLLKIDHLIKLQSTKNDLQQKMNTYPDEKRKVDRREDYRQRERYELALRASNDGVWDWDLISDEVYYSPRWCEIIGFHEGELDPSPPSWLSRVHPEDVELFDQAIKTHLAGATDRLVFEYRLRHKNGSYRWVLTRGQVVYFPDGKLCRMVGSQTDITDRKRAEQALTFNALHDPLTGLANRTLFMERLQQIIIHQKRDPSLQYAVLFLDVDKFKEVNYNYGNEIGDEVLKTIVQRMNICVRKSDTLARFGGDEFAILVAGTESEEDIIGLAKRIKQEVEKPIIVKGEEISVTLSIGIVVDTKGYEDAEESIRAADHALYTAKTNGRDRIELFNPSMVSGTSKHFSVQSTLAGAADRHEFIMHYQPVVSLETGEIKGFEALIRWEHPESGIVYPLDFIPIAEETGLINEIGAWGIEEACRQLTNWQKNLPNSRDWFMCVNVSGRQLENDSFPGILKKILSDTDVLPSNLVIEITENVLMHDIINIEPILIQLKELGVKLAIDDFGTGYSSLAVVNDFPFDIIKIAREFISDIDSRAKSARTVRMIHLLAKAINLQTIVEGIETEAELRIVQNIGLSLAQGYLFSKPKDAASFDKLLEHGTKNIFPFIDVDNPVLTTLE